MVVTVSLQYILKYPVEAVFKCYNERYTDLNSFKIKSAEHVDTKQDGEMECCKRIISINNFFPSMFQRIKLLKIELLQFEEECWSFSSNRKYWIRSRNITWEDEATVADTSYLSPVDYNGTWTQWNQESCVDFGSLGKLGLILELYMKRHIQIKMKEDIKILESKLSIPNKI